MKLIPAGEFDMGNEEDGPVHRVKLTHPFYLGIYPVTQAQYQAVMGKNPSRFKGSDHPVETVSWNDATKFCKKLSKKLGREFSLPTEAQWEYACRAGTTTEYCFGDDEDDLSDFAWYDENSGDETHRVGKKRANALGLYDMHGNVLEWCQDWYGEYPSGGATDPSGPRSGAGRVIRGGGWSSNARFCRSADRIWISPDIRLDILGLRLARSTPSLP